LIVLSDNHISIFDTSFKLKRSIELPPCGKISGEMLSSKIRYVLVFNEISWISQEFNMRFSLKLRAKDLFFL